ncbi:unnamed protein product [Agarophyton chilense]|eukprot:gb/GEZJ01002272.1/.p1 GENE.gb/GEZJ01002272.1/~~gb/GEZJ01002272.1/.p1  ORF type:complete len:606 (+),score=104.13 gb/GEZJ01002272.1/:1092-2909(+)
MSYMKQSVASLAAFFERRSRELFSQDQTKCSNEVTEACTSNEDSAAKIGTSSDPGMKLQLESMVHDFWNELVSHARKSGVASIEQFFPIVCDNMKNTQAVNVSEEVYRRELISALEAFRPSHAHNGGKNKKLDSEEQVIINSIKHRLRKMSDQAQVAEDALHMARKEIHDLEYTREEDEKKRRKLFTVLEEVRSENRELQSRNTSLLKSLRDQETDFERLQAAKRIVDVEKLRSMHKAEMAELVAKQSSLRCTMFHTQLREAESSSYVVHEHVDELERVLHEIRILLTSSSNSSEDSNGHFFRFPLEALVHKGSKLLGKLGVSLSGHSNEAGTSGRNRQQPLSEADILAENRTCEEALASKSKKLSRDLLSGSNKRIAQETQPRLLRKVKSRLQHGPRNEERTAETGTLAGDEHLGDSQAPNSGAKLFRGLLSGAYLNEKQNPSRLFCKVTSGSRHDGGGGRFRRKPLVTPPAQASCIKGNRRSATDVTREAEDGPNSKGMPTTLADFKRILSLNSHPDHRSQLQGREPLEIKSIGKTLESLGKNLDTLRDVVESKEEEIHRLRRQLRASVKLSDAFEQGLRKEYQKRVEMEKIMEANEKKENFM